MLYSYVVKRAEDFPPFELMTGVPRFDSMLHRIFPELVSLNYSHIDATCVGDEGKRVLSAFCAGSTVITDNHLSLDVPEEVKTVVVHHGSADIHRKRDPQWRTEGTRQSVIGQERMYNLKNRVFVSPSDWVREAFDDLDGKVIPHWVESIPQLPKSGKPIIIGDWRDNNKGANVWRKLAAANPQWEFRPLNFRTEADKLKQYGEASLYLCLSLSEGGAYSMCDAEAAELPIVTTDVGNYREFSDCEVISWKDRDNLQIVSDAIERKLKTGRQQPSFYKEYTFEKWAELWKAVVQ